MPGNQWIPPQQPPNGPYPPQPYPGGSLPPLPPGPGPGPSRNRGPLIIGGAVIVAGAIVATALVATRQGSGGPLAAAPTSSVSETSSAATTSTTPTASAAAGPTYQVVPQSTLPAIADVSRLTGITMSNVAAPLVSPSPDANTTPPSCMSASDSASQSAWKPARAMAGQRYIEGTFDNYSSSSAAGLAVFAGSADAATSLKIVSGSVRGCTSFTVPDWNPKNPPANWTVTDVDHGDDHIAWSTTAANGWSCRRSYRVVANLAANAVVCSDKAAAGAATALTDFVIANATKQ
ncbi:MULTISPECIES: sensor domain-containing protein [unclassified Mycolicibacterium]|uniref:PknH-like extracellular domain-containing protein n=1 Tax=Mycolicibacterium sp. CBMA 213 TaxID=1968788 RepID=A0A343VRJ4_9MYCO|nr:MULTISPECIES: sensor domain-containing protein [unclassified Mycolicibacterium]AVN58518.1 hypothetical protein B5P44_p00223 [Mycolicibacterium sp. CBMA 213]MUL61163.1 sensor domain-containing protein [Mycolicibacterium sp. CBMA 335]